MAEKNPMSSEDVIERANLQAGTNRMALTRRSAEDIAASSGEHRAFARDAVNQDLLMALALAVATPAYATAKLAKEKSTWAKDALNYTGLVNADATPPSIAQVLAGYEGIAEGIGDRASKAKRSALGLFNPS